MGGQFHTAHYERNTNELNSIFDQSPVKALAQESKGIIQTHQFGCQVHRQENIDMIGVLTVCCAQDLDLRYPDLSGNSIPQ